MDKNNLDKVMAIAHKKKALEMVKNLFFNKCDFVEESAQLVELSALLTFFQKLVRTPYLVDLFFTTLLNLKQDFQERLKIEVAALEAELEIL